MTDVVEVLISKYDRSAIPIKEPPRVNHSCLRLDQFHVQVAAERSQQFGIAPRVRKDKPVVYFEAPDGITVQLESKDYRGCGARAA